MSSSPHPHVAAIGLGTMGEPMAHNLLRAGFPLTVFNRTPSRADALVAAGASWAPSAAAAVAQADRVLVCLPDTPDVRSLFSASGQNLLAQMKRGSVVVDTSTISPRATRELAREAASFGIAWIDAPVSGGPEGAKKGTLAIMCGGEAEAFERALPLLQTLGQTVTHVGGPGHGQIAKATNQVILAGTYQALAEALVMAKKLGADPSRVVQAISGGAARSWVLENRGPNMLRDEYPLGFKVSLHRKDLAIALEEARAAAVAMPLTALVASQEDALIAQGFAEEDVSALGRLTRRAAGLPAGPL